MAVRIRDMVETDSAMIVAALKAQGWQRDLEQYENYYRQMQAGQRDVLLAQVDGRFAGYLCVNWCSDYPPFRENGIPEIQDLNTLIAFQQKGVATALMDEAERRAALRSDSVGIGVGLTASYGPAQRMYVRRGYVPDGKGISHNERFLDIGDSVTVDHDLVLCLIKRLR